MNYEEAFLEGYLDALAELNGEDDYDEVMDESVKSFFGDIAHSMAYKQKQKAIRDMQKARASVDQKTGAGSFNAEKKRNMAMERFKKANALEKRTRADYQQEEAKRRAKRAKQMQKSFAR